MHGVWKKRSNSEAYSEPSQTTKRELFAKIFSDFSAILNVWLGCECTSEHFHTEYLTIKSNGYFSKVATNLFLHRETM